MRISSKVYNNSVSTLPLQQAHKELEKQQKVAVNTKQIQEAHHKNDEHMLWNVKTDPARFKTQPTHIPQ